MANLIGNQRGGTDVRVREWAVGVNKAVGVVVRVDGQGRAEGSRGRTMPMRSPAWMSSVSACSDGGSSGRYRSVTAFCAGRVRMMHGGEGTNAGTGRARSCHERGDGSAPAPAWRTMVTLGFCGQSDGGGRFSESPPSASSPGTSL